MTATLPRAEALPERSRRLVIYVVYDRRGDVGDYVVYALAALRQHAARILVVVNGSLTDAGRTKLADVTDEILVRPNEGFDIGAHRDALHHVGSGIDAFDEVILANDTWYGPIREFGPVFERMDSRTVDFWGMTEHPEQIPNPFTGGGVLPRHLQSFWIAVRKRMFLSLDWRTYWAELPVIATYNDAILLHEAVFTKYFDDRGFSSDVAFPASDYPSEHAAIFHADLLVRDGCPLLKRRTLFHHPTFLLRHAIIGRDLVAEADSFGYPIGLIYDDLARNVAPRTLNANLGLLEVFAGAAVPPVDCSRVVFVIRSVQRIHLRSLAPWVHRVPDEVLPIALVAEGEDVDLFAAAWRDVFPGRRIVVRAGAPAGEHPLPGAADLIGDEDVDLIVCVDAGIWDGGDTNERRYLRRQQLESMLGRTDWLSGLLELFAREPGLGLTFPLPPHAGALSEALRWPTTRGDVERAVRRWGMRVPVDEFGPLAPAAGIWAARPAALRRFHGSPAERNGESDSGGGWALRDLLLPYAAAELGFYARTVATAEYAATSHGVLEYKLDRLLETTRGHRLEQIQFLQRAQWRGDVSSAAIVKMHMRTNHPDGTHPALPAIRWGRRGIARARRAIGRLLGRGSR